MGKIENYIELAENKWLDQLYSYCRELFSKKRIVSHDHSHHLRVWEYSKEILFAINSHSNIDYSLVESCLIASLFHDTGLTKNLDESHGKESREICEHYFRNKSLSKPDSIESILSAIVNHDDKEYKNNNTKPDSVLSILCTADDLDAFGKIGIVRYTEIYLLRGMELNRLANSVINNLNKRFANFEGIYKDFPMLYEKYKARYLISRKFFEDLEKEF